MIPRCPAGLRAQCRQPKWRRQWRGNWGRQPGRKPGWMVHGRKLPPRRPTRCRTSATAEEKGREGPWGPGSRCLRADPASGAHPQRRCTCRGASWSPSRGCGGLPWPPPPQVKGSQLMSWGWSLWARRGRTSAPEQVVGNRPRRWGGRGHRYQTGVQEELGVLGVVPAVAWPPRR